MSLRLGFPPGGLRADFARVESLRAAHSSLPAEPRHDVERRPALTAHRAPRHEGQRPGYLPRPERQAAGEASCGPDSRRATGGETGAGGRGMAPARKGPNAEPCVGFPT
jgi:hypothetical protein